MAPIRINSLSFRQIVLYVVSGVCALVFVGYVLFQGRHLITGPQISLAHELPTVQHEKHITLSGYAHNITKIFLNGRPILTTPQGKFKEVVTLENGYTVVTIHAEDRYGRTTSITRPFVYKEPYLSILGK